MCGIAAVYNGELHEVIRMGNALKHRGTTSNITEIGKLKIWFSHLAITDQNAPPQPFRCGKYWVWLNGYISNWRELAHAGKIEMETECDTELLANFIARAGAQGGSEYTSIYQRLKLLNGFFSILFYNEETEHIGMVTDRYGVKQLYTYTRGETMYIASEVKALLAVNQIEISEHGAEDWLYSLGVMNEQTIYEGIKRVDRLPFFMPKPISISYQQAKEQLAYLLMQSVQRNKVAGLKDGVFLSGGIDSGILADRLNPDFSFSMDYQDERFSESENIRRNSRGIHLGMICNEKLFNEYKHQTADVLDDLKAGSCYTNFALTELASKFCTVLYSGAGGDEVFDGYTHRYGRPINEVIRRTLITDDCPVVSYKTEGMTHKDYDWKFLRAILVVEDRMAGFHTMETRYPLLDNDFVDFALSLPPEYRQNKRILKDISGLSKEVVEGKKRGFSNPHMTNFQWAAFVLKNKRKPTN
jgi:asparagine synthase (glutamine-hydrolysing)